MNIKISEKLSKYDNTPVILNGVNNEVRINSIELVEMINTFRKEEGDAVEKEHKDLLKSIRTEIETLKNAGIIGQGNFSPSSYVNSQNKEQPCYSMNKKGVLQMLNKESAVVRFKTTEYIEKMEQKLQAIHNQQLESNYLLLSERFNAFSQTLTEKINKLEVQAEFNHRPTHATKLNWNKVIKAYSKCSADEENIKYIVFAKFSIGKWEDLTSDKFTEVFGYIREIAEKANLINQISLFHGEEHNNG